MAEYGSLDSFEEHALGIVTSPATGASRSSSTAAPVSGVRNGEEEMVEAEETVEAVGADDGHEGDGADEPVVSPSDHASSPLLTLSDFENEPDESSVDDENPIGESESRLHRVRLGVEGKEGDAG